MEKKIYLKDKKNKSVSIQVNKGSNLFKCYQVHFSKDGKSARVSERKSVETLKDYISVETAIKVLEQASEGLENPYLHIEDDGLEYYGSSVKCYVIGNRPATEEEIALAEEELLRRTHQEEIDRFNAEQAALEKAEELLRAKKPGIFKENDE